MATPSKPDPVEPDEHDAPAVDHPVGPAPLPHQAPYPQLLHHQLLTPTAPLSPGAAVRVYPIPAPSSAVAPTWAPDPSGRHEWRWWDGLSWTDYVADHGETTQDPLT